MRMATRPVLSPEGNPLVEFTLGEKTAVLTPLQAEDIATSLQRAATAARYESGMAEAIREHGGAKLASHIVKLTRSKIEARKTLSS